MTTKNTVPLVTMIARALSASRSCARTQNHDWQERHDTWIKNAVAKCMPSGSGFDAGTNLDFNISRPNRLVFSTAFHHMNEDGYYDSWTEHRVFVTPCFVHQFNIQVTGRDRNDIKDYVAEEFAMALQSLEYDPYQPVDDCHPVAVK